MRRSARRTAETGRVVARTGHPLNVRRKVVEFGEIGGGDRGDRAARTTAECEGQTRRDVRPISLGNGEHLNELYITASRCPVVIRS